jgi:GT2 family glycosyltransferase
MSAPRLTIGITTRNRPEALARCLESMRLATHLSPEVIVFDDGSSPAASAQIAAMSLAIPVRVIRDDSAPGVIVGRNRLVEAATSDAVFLMDDDAALFDNDAIERALRVLASDDGIAAVAFAQANRLGEPWDERMQPALGREACYVPAFIGFAHLVRRDIFLRFGYRETFEFYGEEKDLCLRMLDAGLRTVYLPDALVMHEPDPGGRSKQRYLRYVIRNDCLNALYNEPLRRLVWLLPARFALFFRMRRALDVSDPWGWAWIARGIFVRSGSIVRDRRPVSSQTIELWKRMRRETVRYDAQRLQSGLEAQGAGLAAQGAGLKAQAKP